MTKALWISDKLALHRFEWVQNAYSLLERGDERELLPLCQDQGLGYTPFSPLAGGRLTGKYRAGQPFPAGSRMTLRPEPYQRLLNEDVFRGLEALQAAAAQRGTDMAALALAWVMAHPLVSAPILGPRRPDQLDPARRALEIRLSEDERKEIAGLFEIKG
jgi:aryl-alcohol dehydrogenase-like predicted oxidoreductase